MARKLKGYVHVNGEVYGPDSKLPKDVADQITNPKAWEDDGSDSAPDNVPSAYEALGKDELLAEVARRNAERPEDQQIKLGARASEDKIREVLGIDDNIHVGA